MARIAITIDTDGAAFGDGQDPTPEVRRILRGLVVGDRLARGWNERHLIGGDSVSLYDHNGNRAGALTFADGGE